MPMTMMAMVPTPTPAVSGAVSVTTAAVPMTTTVPVAAAPVSMTSAMPTTVPMTAAVSASMTATTDFGHHAPGRRSLYFSYREGLGAAHRTDRGKQCARGESRHHHSFHTCVSSSFGRRGLASARCSETKRAYGRR